MGYLYILSEDDIDDFFYQGCIEKILGRNFQVIPQRIRRGGGLSALRRALPVFLQTIRHTGNVEDTYFLVALDNDRSRAHPLHQAVLEPERTRRFPAGERDKPCRFCDIEQTVTHAFQTERTDWPIAGALVVPVEMLESWQLLIGNPALYQEEAALPLFAEKTAALARNYYASRAVPDQLKDLVRLERRRLNVHSSEDFCLYCVEQLEPARLAQVSPVLPCLWSRLSHGTNQTFFDFVDDCTLSRLQRLPTPYCRFADAISVA
ncbi:MAG: hypothetical protein R3E95_13205 [Thiolinea sp.]